MANRRGQLTRGRALTVAQRQGLVVEIERERDRILRVVGPGGGRPIAAGSHQVAGCFYYAKPISDDGSIIPYPAASDGMWKNRRSIWGKVLHTDDHFFSLPQEIPSTVLKTEFGAMNRVVIQAQKFDGSLAEGFPLFRRADFESSLAKKCVDDFKAGDVESSESSCTRALSIGITHDAVYLARGLARGAMGQHARRWRILPTLSPSTHTIPTLTTAFITTSGISATARRPWRVFARQQSSATIKLGSDWRSRSGEIAASPCVGIVARRSRHSTLVGLCRVDELDRVPDRDERHVPFLGGLKHEQIQATPARVIQRSRLTEQWPERDRAEPRSRSDCEIPFVELLREQAAPFRIQPRDPKAHLGQSPMNARAKSRRRSTEGMPSLLWKVSVSANFTFAAACQATKARPAGESNSWLTRAS
jgi:hypothetical protein